MSSYDSGAGRRAAESASLGIGRYGRTIVEHWKLVLACVVVALLAAGAYTQIATRRYESAAQMIVSPIQPQDTFTVGLPVLHSSTDPTRDTLTGASLITTPAIAQAVIRQLGLHRTPTQLLGDVNATPIGQSDLVAVQATASSAGDAQRIANAFASQTVKTRTAALHRALSTVIPGLQAQLKAESPAVKAADTTSTAELNYLKQLQTSGDPTLVVSSPAQLPTAPFTPRTKLALIAGLIAGLVLGIAAAFAVDALDPKLRREDQLRELLGWRVLARVPTVRRVGVLRMRDHRGPMLPGELSLLAAEGYRVLRMMLDRGSRVAGRSYLITGSAPSEGKTTSAINLAASIAQSGSRVVLIELDLRRPMIARTLNLEVARGTEHVIAGRYELEEALTDVNVGGIEFRTLAVQAPRAQLADSLSYDTISSLVTEAREAADYVVIDSPPLTAVIDALPLANAVDEVVVVARLGVSRLARLVDLRELLSTQSASVAGVLLIGESPRAGTGYYQAAPSTVGDPVERSGVRLGPISSPTE
ncbi:MAG: AAA family ATPase [Solirubrobacterales bacterium]|nr:AAA family ATPase [Solirubrobacterales bacterium]